MLIIIVACSEGFMCSNTQSSIFWEGGGELAPNSFPLDPPLAAVHFFFEQVQPVFHALFGPFEYIQDAKQWVG